MTSPIERKPNNSLIDKEIERVKAIYKKYGLKDQTDEFWQDLAKENLGFIGNVQQSETTHTTHYKGKIGEMKRYD